MYKVVSNKSMCSLFASRLVSASHLQSSNRRERDQLSLKNCKDNRSDNSSD